MVLPLKQLLPVVRRLRRGGKRVAFTNGCFDLLHAGHLDYLKRVKAKADCLIVGVNSDASVFKLKGPGRPLVSARERAALVDALKPVDYVTIFSEPTPLRLIRAIRPSLLAKGGDWSRSAIVGREGVESFGGRIWVTPYLKGHSTTRLVPSLSRVLDANLNRAREGIRVCEEMARFVLEDPALTRGYQRLRYDLRSAAGPLVPWRLLRSRDSRQDVGRPALRRKSGPHRGYRDLAAANAQRLEEALRVLEEFGRLRSLKTSESFAALRFRAYRLEQTLLSRLPAVRHH